MFAEAYQILWKSMNRICAFKTRHQYLIQTQGCWQGFCALYLIFINWGINLIDTILHLIYITRLAILIYIYISIAKHIIIYLGTVKYAQKALCLRLQMYLWCHVIIISIQDASVHDKLMRMNSDNTNRPTTSENTSSLSLPFLRLKTYHQIII